MAELVIDLSVAIAEAIDRPYALFGHCAGALTTLELARALRGLGVPPPVLLAMTQYRHPTGFQDVPRISDASDAHVRDWLEKNIDPASSRLLADPEVYAMAARIARADLRLVEDYVYTKQPPIETSLVCYGDDAVEFETLLPWRSEVSGRFDITMLRSSLYSLNGWAEVGRLLLEDVVQHAEGRGDW